MGDKLNNYVSPRAKPYYVPKCRRDWAHDLRDWMGMVRDLQEFTDFLCRYYPWSVPNCSDSPKSTQTKEFQQFLRSHPDIRAAAMHGFPNESPKLGETSANVELKGYTENWDQLLVKDICYEIDTILSAESVADFLKRRVESFSNQTTSPDHLKVRLSNTGEIVTLPFQKSKEVQPEMIPVGRDPKSSDIPGIFHGLRSYYMRESYPVRRAVVSLLDICLFLGPDLVFSNAGLKKILSEKRNFEHALYLERLFGLTAFGRQVQYQLSLSAQVQPTLPRGKAKRGKTPRSKFLPLYRALLFLKVHFPEINLNNAQVLKILKEAYPEANLSKMSKKHFGKIRPSWFPR